MNPADLDAAISANIFACEMIVKSLAVSGPVEAMILMPLIEHSQNTILTLQQLKAALREAAT